VKNKVAPPFRQCEFDIMYGVGISKEGSLLDVGVDLEIVKKSGAWFTYEGDQLGQGRENARQFLAEHTDIATELERRVREAVGLTTFGAEGDDTPIEVVPDLAETDEQIAPKAAKADKERETTGARAG
jgi:recombination protein RecA